jgi:ribose transport system substrate-binding protein
MRKLVAVLVILAGCLAAPGCHRSSRKQIAVVPMGQAHVFWQSVHAGAVAAGREAGVDVLWNAPVTETDYTAQIQIVDSMISRQVDAVALAPIDRTAMAGVVERASKRGIPVVLFDSGLDGDQWVSRVATDNYGGGRLAATRMGEILKGKGTVAIVAAQPGATSSVAREQGFEETIQQKFPGIQVVDKRFGMADFAKSLAVAENMLTAHPDLRGMFASNETSSVGAARALEGRPGNNKVKLVAFDWSPTLLEGLKSGLVDSLVVQHPFKMGYEAVMTAVRKLNGKPVARINDLVPHLITLQNLNDPDVHAQLNPDLKKYLD